MEGERGELAKESAAGSLQEAARAMVQLLAVVI